MIGPSNPLSVRIFCKPDDVILVYAICYLGQFSKALKSWDIEVISETKIAEGKGHVVARDHKYDFDFCIGKYGVMIR